MSMKGTSALTPRRSEQKTKRAADKLLKETRKAVEHGEDVLPGTPKFWEICGGHLLAVSEIVQTVQQEVEEERAAQDTEARACVVCEGPIVRRYRRGRWPIYCDTCSLKDR
jgi:maltooligosyltrehalose synthase